MAKINFTATKVKYGKRGSRPITGTVYLGGSIIAVADGSGSDIFQLDSNNIFKSSGSISSLVSGGSSVVAVTVNSIKGGIFGNVDYSNKSGMIGIDIPSVLSDNGSGGTIVELVEHGISIDVDESPSTVSGGISGGSGGGGGGGSRPAAVLVDIDNTGNQTIDCSLGERLYDTITANRTIGTINNLTQETWLDITGDFTVDFSAALKADTDNEFQGNDFLEKGKNFIRLVKKESAGMIITYEDGVPDMETQPLVFSNKVDVVTTGINKVSWYSPDYDIFMRLPFASLDTVDNALITLDINVGGVSALTTKLTIDSGQATSDTATTPAVIDATKQTILARSKISVDVDGAGTAGIFGTVQFNFTAV